MRICDNCNFSSYNLNCNTGSETLWCNEQDLEFEVLPDDTCLAHQFIDGLEDEKNYVYYDEKYFGQGFFIIHKESDEITKFIKIIITNNNGFPNYSLRAFSVDGKDNPDSEFNKIEFVFRSIEDFDNGLYKIFLKLSKSVDGKIESIDPVQHGRNNITFSIDNNQIKIVISKDVYHGKQHPSDYIDINLGDNYTCKNYEAINSFYNALMQVCLQTAKEEIIKRLLRLKIK